MKFIAFTTKGLEFVSESEIGSKIRDSKILEVADKRIIFESNSDFESLITLKTVDDLGILIHQINNIADLLSEVNAIDFEKAKKELSNFRKIESDDFSITTSIVGTNISAKDLTNSLSEEIRKKYGWGFLEHTRSDFDIRLFLDHDKGCVSIRLAKESLRNRSYKILSKIGSLKPTIAAAMIIMAKAQNGNLKIVDNFCGSGTILAEALSMGNDVYGGDLDPESVEITKENLANLGSKSQGKIKTLNAIATNWQTGFFDTAISNLPWDKQVKMKSITNLYSGTVREYARIVKPEGIICLLVSNPEIIVKHAKKEIPGCKIDITKIGLLGQTPSIVLIYKKTN